ncbi:Cupredoxin [Hyaloscypha variabilis F]|uniref:Cupredoxin n=1 Tax=Hyaloscypha variabilis (strain UAMH 11265 / GT02V1 / F) TaxID=1149755 RepID=A0A2J6SB04_HYAVF|nr:Cupredoxin [Hyaloscypha variabilis F]
MYAPFCILWTLAVTTAAKTIVITAGSGGLAFSPDSVTADVGDILAFHFVSSIHSAVSGNFSSPCVQSSTGFDSGPVTSSDVFQVTVQSTDPMWFFCGTPGHCQAGMTGVVNAPSSGDTLTAYKNTAQGASTTTSGTTQGGVVVPVGSVASSSSATSPSSTATSPGSSTSPVAPTTSSTTGATTSAAGTSTSSSSSTPSHTAGSNGGASSLIEASGRAVLFGLVFGLGGFVVLMA